MIKDARRESVDKAIEIIPRFMDIANSLRLSRDEVNGLTGLAGELVNNKFTSYSKSVKYHELFKAKGYDVRRMKKYSHRA